MNYLQLFSCCLRAVLLNRATLVAENLALRQQLAILQRARPRPKLRNRDRLFWIVLSRLWHGWQSVLLIVSPATVVRWHRREAASLPPRLGAPSSRIGAPRIQAELRLLGHDLAPSTVAKYSWPSHGNNSSSVRLRAVFPQQKAAVAVCPTFICSGDRRLIDSLNGSIQHGVELGIGLMDRQPCQQRPREACHHPVILA